MRYATAVIGANYGDEGKGLIVDALSGPDTVVVRYNGGAQAGHTVVTPEGRRHVFHHHGAGTLRDAATYLSRHFILNPVLFEREHYDLGSPRVLASKKARITTPYDMMLNRWAEEDRGVDRHGSCGLGINETVVRYSTGVTKVSEIVLDYVPERAKQLDIELTPERQHLLNSDAIASQYVSAYRMMCASIEWKEADEVEGEILFEGAQGLLLDQDAPGFPHVTRSKTGLTNVLELCAEMDVAELHAIFATRTYLTRHGAGPMPTEDPELSFPDTTNHANPWQQTLRFGRLDVHELTRRVADEAVSNGILVQPSIAMTCVDQLDNEELRSVCSYESRGPTRQTFCSL